jgi:phage terminase Nu1 subunit (DNA packaging protein)
MPEKQAVIFDNENVFILQSGMDIYLKTADLCAMFGVSNQWLGQLVSQGTLSKVQTDNGKLFNLTDSVKSYIDSLQEKVKKTEDEKKLDKAKSAAEVKLKAAKATMAQLQADELKGKMHRSEDVQAFTQSMVDTIKQALLSLPGRMSVELSLCETAEECSVIIKDTVKDVLRELSEFEYDPEKYEAMVRERENLSEKAEDDTDDI